MGGVLRDRAEIEQPSPQPSPCVQGEGDIDGRNPGLCFIARLCLHVFAAKPQSTLAEDVHLISLRGIVSVETLAPSEAA